MYQRLEEVLGREQAATLMEHLPPVGWADIATKRDLDALEERVALRVDLAIERALRQQTYRMMGFFTAMMAVTVAAVRF
jgi:hypothetical protein